MEKKVSKNKPLLKVIREKCIDCCVGSVYEVKLCHIKDCVLHPYRLGKNPFKVKKQYTDAEKVVLASRLAEFQAKKKK